MDFKEVNYFECVFKDFKDKYSAEIAEQFGKELKEPMEKYSIKSIVPTHNNSAQISRHINDNEIHFVGMYFTAEKK